ncbi:MAG: phosphotransferase family protein, partial [SAR324 cluster bacterium]|nr:phosphotransferase family protein [SAR324 cluster bacterium]
MKGLPHDKSVESCLAKLREHFPAWQDAELELQPLEGGITNKNFRVEAGGVSYVLRLFGSGSELLGINRDHEHTCSEIADRLGVGAEVVYYDPAVGLLVTRFIEGAVLSPETASRPEVIARIAEILRVVHGGPDFPGSFSPFEMARAYHRRASERHGDFPERFRPCFAVMERVESALAGGPPPRPCHNDLLAGNFLDDGRNI